MLSTRKIKRKIRSVGNIKKITRAMEMVSAANLKKAQSKLLALRPYAAKLQQMLNNLMLNTESTEHPFPKRAVPDDVAIITGASKTASARKTVIIITSNKGLCGSYNTNLLKTAVNFTQQQENLEVVSIGRKAYEYYQRRNYSIRQSFNQIPADLNFNTVKEIINPLVRDYEGGLLDEIWLVYAEFVNAITNRPMVKRFLPLEPVGAKRLTGSYPDESRRDGTTSGMEPKEGAVTASMDYIFEPDPKTVLDLLIPCYVEVSFYRVLLESLASEHSARMLAMRNATGNAEEVIDELTLTFNKARQASITKELLDIVGGAEAMRG
ncbi:MAG: ATP synthase F1 subunit gamma [Planctomycetes bacterium]|nr:ATP synthase F1 subunit gamma [Planctomycetota bacterium]